MNWLSQIIAVTGVTLRSIPQRLGSSIVAIIGIAGVVIVFTAVLSIAEGFRAAMKGTGDPQTVIVLRSGSDTEMTSGFSGEEARLISEAPGDRDRAGRAARLARALRHRRTSAQAIGHRRERAASWLDAHRAAGASAGEDRRGADVHAGHERNRRRPGRVAAVPGTDDRHVGALG